MTSQISKYMPSLKFMWSMFFVDNRSKEVKEEEGEEGEGEGEEEGEEEETFFHFSKENFIYKSKTTIQNVQIKE